MKDDIITILNYAVSSKQIVLLDTYKITNLVKWVCLHCCVSLRKYVFLRSLIKRLSKSATDLSSCKKKTRTNSDEDFQVKWAELRRNLCTRNSGSRNLGISKSRNFWISKSWNLGISESRNLGILKSRSRWNSESWDLGI